MATTISSYAELQSYLNALLTSLISTQTGDNELQDTKTQSPHRDFWNTLTFQQFVTGNVPGVTDPNTGKPMPILVKGNASQSNFIKALQGAPGSPFDPNTGAFGQMPADGPPFLSVDQIQPIADWINAGCPDGVVSAVTPAVSVGVATGPANTKKAMLVEALQQALENVPPPPAGVDIQHFELLRIDLEHGGFTGTTRTRVMLSVKPGPLGQD